MNTVKNVMCSFLLFNLLACGNDNLKNQTDLFMNERFIFPSEKMYLADFWLNGETKRGYNRDIHIVVYADSLTCSPCYIKGLSNWNAYLFNEDKYNLTFDFVVSIKRKEKQRTEVLFSNCGLEHSVYLDTCNAFRKANPNFPSNKLFHTFVVNNEGKVLMVGNPFQDEKMEALFQKVIAREKKRKSNTSCKL